MINDMKGFAKMKTLYNIHGKTTESIETLKRYGSVEWFIFNPNEDILRCRPVRSGWDHVKFAKDDVDVVKSRNIDNAEYRRLTRPSQFMSANKLMIEIGDVVVYSIGSGLARGIVRKFGTSGSGVIFYIEAIDGYGVQRLNDHKMKNEGTAHMSKIRSSDYIWVLPQTSGDLIEEIINENGA